MRIFRRSGVAYGRTPEPVTPYQKAAQVWDERIGSARVQARNWRLMAFAAALVALALALALAATAGGSRIVPYVVEVDPAGGARAVGPAGPAAAPSDGQVAWHLARFVENFRGLPLDPVVLRANWLEAYAHATDRGAGQLSDYAQAADPFADVGERTVAVEVTSAVRSSASSFALRWRERVRFQGGPEEVRRYTAAVAYVVHPPDDEATLRANPLGIYVHDFHWSRDLDTGETE